jgi:protein-L-isoaspartate O-methyltransferase
MIKGSAIGTDYVLGTHDDEIARLGTQHQVWRAHMLDAWTRAGITRGSSLVDFGAGPGYATCDAAEIVGREGRVTAVERSPAFLEFARRQIERRGISWVSFVAADLISDDLPLSGFDLAWCRWVASFVSSPTISRGAPPHFLDPTGPFRLAMAARRGHDHAARPGNHRRKN